MGGQVAWNSQEYTIIADGIRTYWIVKAFIDALHENITVTNGDSGR